MTTSTRESATDKLFDFLIERQASLFGVVGTATERYHRFNGSVIESARQSSLGWTDVGKRWLASPGDIIGLYEAASEAINASVDRRKRTDRRGGVDRQKAGR